MAVQISIRRDTRANWTSANPVLALGEIGLITGESPTSLRIGDGTHTWSLLAEQHFNLLNDYSFKGKALVNTNPGTVSVPTCYFANAAGTYTYFSGLVVSKGEIVYFINNGDGTSWQKLLISLVEGTVTDSSNNAVSSKAIYDFLKSAGYEFAGVLLSATDSVTLASPVLPSFVLTNIAGTYVNFSSLVVNEGECCAFLTANGAVWTKYILSHSDFQTGQHIHRVSIINNVTTGGVNNVLSAEQGKVLEQEIVELRSIVNQILESL